MKTCIVYISRHGTTETVVEKLSNALDISSNSIFNLKENYSPDISDYQQVIIGGSIHIGGINKTLRKFLKLNMELMTNKQIALFLCCLEKGDKAMEQFNNAFSPELRDSSIAAEIVGGEFLPNKMSFIERKITQKIMDESGYVSGLDYEAIDGFIKKIQNS